MSKKHQVQHKERREKATGKELATIKKENNQLKRTVSRLTKQLSKTIEVIGAKEEAAQPVSIELQPEAEGGIPKCGACGSVNLRSMKLPTGQLTVCKACGWRQKV